MATIYTSKGCSILVDDADFEWLNQFKWTVNGQGYAVGRATIPDGTKRNIAMHRLITNAPTGMQVDHINHLRADNRRSNLRVCTHRENMQNKNPVRRMIFDKKTNKHWLLRGFQLIGIYDTYKELHQAWIEADHGGTPKVTNTTIPID